jgi:hypothetical protein
MCFKCGGVFPIGDAVARLFQDASTAAFELPLPEAAPWGAAPPAPPQDHEAVTLGIPAEQVSAVQHAAEEILSDPSPATLSLDDLVGADDEIMEKTLIGLPPPEAPPAAPAYEPAEGGYASAADAISRLLGGVAHLEPAKQRPLSTRMDLEATLSALESSLKAPADFDGPTLGGVAPPPPAPMLPPLPPPPAMHEPEPRTVQLSAADLRAAMQTAAREDFVAPPPPDLERTLLLPAMEAPPKASLMPPGTPSAPTLAMPSPLVAPLPAPPSNIATPPIMAGTPGVTVQYPSPTLQLPTPPPPGAGAQSANDPNLLKVNLGSDTLANLTMDEVIRLVESGEIQEFHMVARQFSENWLEASKVPALRPVFERVRRLRPPEPPPAAALPSETAPVKKSLFGGLFGKKE